MHDGGLLAVDSAARDLRKPCAAAGSKLPRPEAHGPGWDEHTLCQVTAASAASQMPLNEILEKAFVKQEVIASIDNKEDSEGTYQQEEWCEGRQVSSAELKRLQSAYCSCCSLRLSF